MDGHKPITKFSTVERVVIGHVVPLKMVLSLISTSPWSELQLRTSFPLKSQTSPIGSEL